MTKYPEGDKLKCPLSWVLSVTTGVLMTDMVHVHELLEFATGRPQWTHQLPRAAEACRGEWKEKYPALFMLEGEPTKETWREWLENAEKTLGKQFVVTRLSSHANKNPLTELAEKIGTAKEYPTTEQEAYSEPDEVTDEPQEFPSSMNEWK